MMAPELPDPARPRPVDVEEIDFSPRPRPRSEPANPRSAPPPDIDERRAERMLVDALQTLPDSPFKRSLQLAYQIVQRRDRKVLELSDEMVTTGDPGRLAYLLAEFERLSGIESTPVGLRERLGAQTLTVVNADPPPPLLLERLDPAGHTILFGTGGVGKGTLAASWMVQLVSLGQRVLIVDYENHPDEWARRMRGFGAIDEELANVLHVAPLTAAWKGTRGAIWQQADDLRSLATDFGAHYMLVDSTVPACAGSDPLKPEAVSLYAGALEYIGLPTLSLAHMTKVEDLRYPFGSVFWHNLARITMSLHEDGAAVVLTHRKSNNYERFSPLRVEVVRDGAGVPVNLNERAFQEDLSRRISLVLVGRSLSVEEICEALDDESPDAPRIKEDTVSKALRRGAKGLAPKFRKDGRRWRNA